MASKLTKLEKEIQEKLKAAIKRNTEQHHACEYLTSKYGTDEARDAWTTSLRSLLVKVPDPAPHKQALLLEVFVMQFLWIVGSTVWVLA